MTKKTKKPFKSIPERFSLLTKFLYSPSGFEAVKSCVKHKQKLYEEYPNNPKARYHKIQIWKELEAKLWIEDHISEVDIHQTRLYKEITRLLISLIAKLMSMEIIKPEGHLRMIQANEGYLKLLVWMLTNGIK